MKNFTLLPLLREPNPRKNDEIVWRGKGRICKSLHTHFETFIDDSRNKSFKIFKLQLLMQNFQRNCRNYKENFAKRFFVFKLKNKKNFFVLFFQITFRFRWKELDKLQLYIQETKKKQWIGLNFSIILF